jgi:hypothetical protein
MKYFLVSVVLAVVLVGGCILSSQERAEYALIKERLGTYAPMVVAGVESRIAGKSTTVEMLKIVNTAMQNYAADYARKQQIEANETPWWKIAGVGLSWALTIAGVFFGGRYPVLKTLGAVVRGVETAGNKDVKKAIESEAIRTGVEAALEAFVQNKKVNPNA